LPVGYELKSGVEPILIKTRFGTYEQMLSVENGKIVVVKKIELFSGSYSVEQYIDLYSFIQSVKDVDRRKIIIKPINKTS
jgi:hypothetical protein